MIKSFDKLVMVICSTGGPKALSQIIPVLKSNLDAPVVVVQHMPKGFTPSLASRLNYLSEIKVSEAHHRHTLKKGRVYIAQGGMHLQILQEKDGSLIFNEDDSEPVNGLKPYANKTLLSLLPLQIEHLYCVVLTGMGCDGYDGIYHLKQQKNIYTIAQSKETCIVYGMPKAIINNDLADQILPLELIGNEINNKVGVF